MTNRETLIGYIIASKLETPQKQQFIGFLEFMGDDNLEDLVSLFKSDPSAVLTFYENVKAKHAAAHRQDMGAMRKILEQEKVMLSKEV